MGIKEANQTLKILGVITLIFGIFGILASLGIFAGGSMLFGELANSGELQNANPQDVSTVTGLLTVAGIATLISSIVDIALGFFSIRAAGDPDKINPAYTFALIGLVLAVASAIISLMNGINYTSITSSIVSLLFSGILFRAAKTIKESV